MADMRHSMEAISADKKILEERLAKEKVCEIISGACTIILYSKMKQIWNVTVQFTAILPSPVDTEAPSR